MSNEKLKKIVTLLMDGEFDEPFKSRYTLSGTSAKRLISTLGHSSWLKSCEDIDEYKAIESTVDNQLCDIIENNTTFFSMYGISVADGGIPTYNGVYIFFSDIHSL